MNSEIRELTDIVTQMVLTYIYILFHSKEKRAHAPLSQADAINEAVTQNGCRLESSW